MASRTWGIRNLGLGLVMGLALLLNGCFQSDLTLRFDHHHHGQWVQTITLGERNLAAASDALSPWLQQIRTPVRQFGGHLRQTPGTIELTVPFSTPAELAERFNQVFAAPSEPSPPESGSLATDLADDPLGTTLVVPGLGAIPFHLETQERNWGLFSQVRLIYDLDLRPVALPPEVALGGDALRSDPVSFQLQVPWGVKGLEAASLPPAQITATGARWMMPLGELSHIDVRFWLPNGLGLGGLAIAGAVLLGYVVRYRWLGPPR